jgi:hypothetical protein
MFFSVGKKFILVLACSILRSYNGEYAVQEEAMTAATIMNTRTTLTSEIDTFFDLFMLSPPLALNLLL